MKHEFENKITKGRLIMLANCPDLKGEGMLNGQTRHINSLIVNKSSVAQKVMIDNIHFTMPGPSLLPLVSNQHFRFEKPEVLISWHFNREFYCIVDHDEEVSCAGFLFFGIHHPMFIRLNSEDLDNIIVIEKLFHEDMQLADRMQEEMLRTLLKRLIIKATRMARAQAKDSAALSLETLDIFRQFNLLVEIHYRQEHEVSFYAARLNKSPKTLANLFRLCNYPSPLSIIHKRIIIEAQRYLHYTAYSAKEICHALGFESAAHFSRFFKLKTGMNISRSKAQMQ
jgi:AraC family transcriptional regulator, transcriptional activator of pobA